MRVAERRSRVGHLLDTVTGALVDVAGAMLVFMVLLINVEIGGRYLFGYSTLISDEYSGYLFAWATFLGFGYALRTGQFLRVEMLAGRLRGRPGDAAAAIAALIGFFVCAVACANTARLCWTSFRFSSVSIQPSATPLFIPQLVMPIGMGLLALLYLSEFLARLRRAIAGQSEGGG